MRLTLIPLGTGEKPRCVMAKINSSDKLPTLGEQNNPAIVTDQHRPHAPVEERRIGERYDCGNCSRKTFGGTSAISPLARFPN
jgi:hypothetical protein